MSATEAEPIVEVAQAHGVTHFVRHARNRGLGR